MLWCLEHSAVQLLCKSPPVTGVSIKQCIPNPSCTAANERPVPRAAEITSDSPQFCLCRSEISLKANKPLRQFYTSRDPWCAPQHRAPPAPGSPFCLCLWMQLKNLFQVTASFIRILCDSSVEENVRSSPLCYSWIKDNWEFPVVLVRWHLASRSNCPPYPERQWVVKIGCSAPFVKLNTPRCCYIWDFQPTVAWWVLVVEHASPAAICSNFICLVLVRHVLGKYLPFTRNYSLKIW